MQQGYQITHRHPDSEWRCVYRGYGVNRINMNYNHYGVYCHWLKTKKLGIGDVEFFGVGVDGFEPPTLCL